jgi:hypothetical protein
MAALPAPFDSLPPTGVNNTLILWAIYRSVTGAGGSSGSSGMVVSDPDTAPASNASAVTPSDATVLAVTRGLYIGTGGDVVVTMEGGGDVTFANAQDGSILPIKVTKVKSATSASDIVALR